MRQPLEVCITKTISYRMILNCLKIHQSYFISYNIKLLKHFFFFFSFFFLLCVRVAPLCAFWFMKQYLSKKKKKCLNISWIHFFHISLNSLRSFFSWNCCISCISWKIFYFIILSLKAVMANSVAHSVFALKLNT